MRKCYIDPYTDRRGAGRALFVLIVLLTRIAISAIGYHFATYDVADAFHQFDSVILGVNVVLVAVLALLT